MMNPNIAVQNGSIQHTSLVSPGNSVGKEVNKSHDSTQSIVGHDSCVKRPRLSSHSSLKSQSNNCVTNTPSTPSTNLRDVLDGFRLNFHENLKDLMLQRFSAYFSRLNTVEQDIACVRTQQKELTNRMDGVESASKQLMKVIKYKCSSLPTPSTGIGQRRTLSSQAPRLPPPPPLQPATEALSKPPPPPAPYPDSRQLHPPMPVVVANSAAPTPIAAVASQQKCSLPTHPSGGQLPSAPVVRANNISPCPPAGQPNRIYPVEGVGGGGGSGGGTETTTTLTTANSHLQQTKPFNRHPLPSQNNSGPGQLQAAAATETIDLTESDSTNGEATTVGSAAATAVPDRPPHPGTSSLGGDVVYFQIPQSPMASCIQQPVSNLAQPGSALLSTLNQPIMPRPSAAPRQKRLSQSRSSNAHSQPPRHSPLSVAQSANQKSTSAAAPPPAAVTPVVTKPGQIPITVAPLPPTPIPQIVFSIPTQPMPQLTIAEAVEGICLQWSVCGEAVSYEPAVSYEIFSYASSDLTVTNMFTCLPWKKIGDVTALPLPMACTLTHIQSNNIYYFIIRSVDRFERCSAWSNVVHAFVG